MLITGGGGFIGSHLADALVRLGAEVTVLDDFSHGNPKNLDPASGAGGDLRVIQASLLDADPLRDAMADARLVFHLAALGSVAASIEQPELYHDVNVTGTLRVLQAARAAGGGGAVRVLFASSAAVYGPSAELPKIETMSVDPVSPYAANKAAGEAMMGAWAASYAKGGDGGGGGEAAELDTVSLRYFNIFGPRQSADSAYAAVIGTWAGLLLRGVPPQVHGDGSQTRDFCPVANVVHANLLAARHPTPLRGRGLNIGTGQSTSLHTLLHTLLEITQRPDLEPIHTDPRPGDVPHSLADIHAAKSVLGYHPIMPFKEGLAQTVAWYSRHIAPHKR